MIVSILSGTGFTTRFFSLTYISFWSLELISPHDYFVSCNPGCRSFRVSPAAINPWIPWSRSVPGQTRQPLQTSASSASVVFVLCHFVPLALYTSRRSLGLNLIKKKKTAPSGRCKSVIDNLPHILVEPGDSPLRILPI